MKRVDEGVAAGATNQHIAAAFAAAEDVVAVTARQHIVKIATEQLIVASRSHLVDRWIVRHASPLTINFAIANQYCPRRQTPSSPWRDDDRAGRSGHKSGYSIDERG